jgi:hypothetical protein
MPHLTPEVHYEDYVRGVERHCRLTTNSGRRKHLPSFPFPAFAGRCVEVFMPVVPRFTLREKVVLFWLGFNGQYPRVTVTDQCGDNLIIPVSERFFVFRGFHDASCFLDWMPNVSRSAKDRELHRVLQREN